VADRNPDTIARRRPAVRRWLPPTVVGAAAVAAGVGGIAWTAARAGIPAAAPTAGVGTPAGAAGLAAADRALQQLQQQLAADTQRLAALLPARSSSAPASAPATHTTTGASGVP